MPKPFNQKLHDDITALSSLTKGTSEYKKEFKRIMQAHNICRATVYNELSKHVPGSYKKYESTGRTVEISSKEIISVSNLIDDGWSNKYIRSFMSFELGFSYSETRLKKVKHLLNLNGKPVLPETPPEYYIEKAPEQDICREEITFKGNIRRLFSALAKLEKMPETTVIKIKLNGKIYKVSKMIIKSCLDRIAASAEMEGKNIEEIIRFNIESILLDNSANYKNGAFISPAGILQLDAARRSISSSSPYNRSICSHGGYNIDDIYSVVEHFSPTVSREDVIEFIKSKNGENKR